MGKKELVANRQYTDEFKVEAVKLGESIGGNQAAKRLGIPESAYGIESGSAVQVSSKRLRVAP
jgi:transposase-like protein